MTREEARQIIAAWLVSSKGEKGQCGYIEGWFYEKDAEAFYMAIEALEQEPYEDKCSDKCKETYACDCINRQAAIDAVHSYFKDKLDELPTEIDEDGYEVYCDMKKVNMFLSDNKHLSKKIKNLPSAQLKCKTDVDTISRQAAIDALAKEMPSLTTPDGCGEFDHDIQITDEAFVDCMQIINGLPSAQPEIIRCKDCKHLQKWRSEESAKEFGQIYACARNVFNCPKPEDFCSFAERRAEE